MRQFSSLLLAIMLLVSVISKAQWIQVTGAENLPAQWSAADAIDASDSNTVVIAVRLSDLPQSLYRTTDGGKTWQKISIPYQFGALDVSMADKDHIWIVTGEAKIFATTDGGGSWNVQFNDTSKTDFMNFVRMFDLKNGIAMGDGKSGDAPSLFVKTTDGGSSWSSVSNSTPAGISSEGWRAIDFPDSKTGYFLATHFLPPPLSYGIRSLYKTVNAGASWMQLNLNSQAEAIKFYDDKSGLAVKGDSVYRTNDGGLTWSGFKLSVIGHGNDIEFIPGDPSMVWLTNGLKLYSSKDSGKTFGEYNISSSKFLGRDLVFTDKDHGWLLSDQGLLFKTSNLMHVTGLDETMDKIPESYKLMQNYPNPFNPSTVISFSLARPGFTELKVFDILGNEVRTLISGNKGEGSHSISFNSENLSSGMYFYRLKAGNFTEIKKMMLVK